MAELELTQAEADALIAVEKHRADTEVWCYPSLGESVHIPLVSADRRETFSLDITRGYINLAKVSHQNRARRVVVLLRLDLGGGPHQNPDGSEILCPHLHIYREGFGDKWAYPVPRQEFSDLSDVWGTLIDFMRYCNITVPPSIQRGLFT